MGLAARSATAARMLHRLAAAISAELTAIESAERRADDSRRLRYAVAIGFVSAVAVPIGLIFAFLSTSTAQVTRLLRADPLGLTRPRTSAPDPRPPTKELSKFPALLCIASATPGRCMPGPPS